MFSYFKNIYLTVAFLYIMCSCTDSSNVHNIKLLIQLNGEKNHEYFIDEKNVKKLNELSKEQDFHSDISIIEIIDDKYPSFTGNWILKSVLDDNETLELIAERLAYCISKELSLELVPETFLSLVIDKKLCIIQRFIKGEKMEEDLYKEVLKKESKGIQKLKLFWFLTGQWDIGPENMFFIQNNGIDTPIAIDNGAICNNTYVKSYGSKPFKKRGTSANIANQNSLENPLEIKYCLGTEFTEKLKEEKLSLDYKIHLNRYYNLTYFIENNNVYCELWDGSEIYKLSNCGKEILEQFSKLNTNLCIKLFEQLRKELLALGVLEESLRSKIDNFEKDFIKRVESRVVMIKEHFINHKNA
jgi:hypothetical protein